MHKTLKYILKYLPWILIAVGTIVALKTLDCQNNNNSRLVTYNRQLQGQLNTQEAELQAAHNKIGVSNSKLLKQSELADQLKRDNEEIDKEFDAFRKKHNLQIKSRDRTISSLKQKTSGGTTDVIVYDTCKEIDKHCVIGYSWSDPLKRFGLIDPNIFETGNETFESNQVFKVYAEIWEQKDGSLQTQRLVLREMYKNENGEYVPIPNAKAEIIDSEFTYHNPPPMKTEWKFTDLFTLRPVIIGSIKMFPDPGNIELGLGLEVMGIYGFGLNTHTSLNFSDPEQIGQYIGISYSPIFFDKEMNFGLSVSIGTPFYRFAHEVSVKAGILFYLY